MTRTDFWCRVVGWVQLVSGLVLAAVLLWLWDVVSRYLGLDAMHDLSFVVWLIIMAAALPLILAGLFTVVFANAVEQARGGLRGQRKILLRIVMAVAGLWSAGVIGLAGLSLPPISFYGVLSLITTGLAVMGPDWTADLFGQGQEAP